jgi:WD40 repeat protein
MLSTQPPVTSMVFSLDEQRLALSKGGGRVEVWDVTSKRLIETFTAQGEVKRMAFSPDEQRLALSKGGGRVEVWDVTSKRLIETFTAQGEVWRMAFSPSTLHVATLRSQDRVGEVWDLNDPLKAKMTFPPLTPGHWEPVFSPDGQRLATGGQDGSVTLWDVANGQPSSTLPTAMAAVSSVAFRRDGQQLAVGDDYGTVHLWDLNRKRLTATFTTQVPVSSLAFSPDGQRLATRGADDTIQLWDVTSKAMATIPKQKDNISAVALSPDGQQLTTVGKDGTVQVWDTNSQPMHTISTWQSKSPIQPALSADSRRLATGGEEDGTVQVWDTNGQLMHTISTQQGKVSRIALSFNGQRLATGGKDGTVKLWDGNGQFIKKIDSDGLPAIIKFSSDGQGLMIARAEHANMWDVNSHTSQLILAIPSDGMGNSAIQVDFSAHSQRVVTIKWENAVAQLWNAKGREKTIFSSQQTLRSVAFSFDGQRLATGGEDGTVKLWDGNGQHIATISTPQGAIVSIAFSRDGRRLATRGEDGTVKLWQVGGAQELLARACDQLRGYLPTVTALPHRDKDLCDDIPPDRSTAPEAASSLAEIAFPASPARRERQSLPGPSVTPEAVVLQGELASPATPDMIAEQPTPGPSETPEAVASQGGFDSPKLPEVVEEPSPPGPSDTAPLAPAKSTHPARPPTKPASRNSQHGWTIRR